MDDCGEVSGVVALPPDRAEQFTEATNARAIDHEALRHWRVIRCAVGLGRYAGVHDLQQRVMREAQLNETVVSICFFTVKDGDHSESPGVLF